LEIGCGTGRLLLRFLAAGLEVDGVDYSAEMIAICRSKAAQQGLSPTLYEQAAQNLDLPRRYRTIYIPCGTLGLITDRQQAIEALRRCYAHLEPGGELLLHLFWVFAAREPLADDPLSASSEWKLFYKTTLPDGREIVQYSRQSADGDWKLFHHAVLADGRDLVVQLRRIRLNRAEQVILQEHRYRLMQGEQVVREEIHPAHERWYYKHEMVLLLEGIGFGDIRVKGDFSDEDFADHHVAMVFIARKPSPDEEQIR
jgi:SAM-dependent methyltransferase